ncbi:hypothetical protein [Novosphingobium sp.]|uniref:hypothetical protein n=1 Tax=Novosphingobium sp. TaxID=1874826 RepID=UPI0038BB1541
MRRVALVGLMQMDLPSRTVRLCDGGVIRWGSDVFAAKDAVFGAVGGFEELKEGVGDELPALDLTLIPPGSSAPATINDPANQGARVRFWIAEYDIATGAVTGTPNLQFDGQLDNTVLTLGSSRRELAVTVTPTADRLLMRSEGNSLSPSFHKSVWPGETGQDDATGLTQYKAWGAENPNQGRPMGIFEMVGNMAWAKAGRSS